MKIRQREIDDVVILDVNGKIMGGPDSEVFQETIKSLIDSGKRKVLVNLENVKDIFSLQATITTTAKNREQGIALLTHLGFPLKK